MRIDSYVAGAALMDQAAPGLDRLRRATQDVEAIFLKDLLGAMRKATPHDDDGDSLGSDIYQDMSDQAFSQAASKSDSLGIGKLLFDRMAPAVIAQARTRQLLQVAQSKTENKG